MDPIVAPVVEPDDKRGSSFHPLRAAFVREGVAPPWSRALEDGATAQKMSPWQE